MGLTMGRWLRLLLLLAGLAAGPLANAQAQPAWQLLEDPGGRWSLDEALARAGEFRPLAPAGPRRTPGYTRTALWARLDLPAAQSPQALWLVVMRPRIEHAQLWVQASDGRWQPLAEAGLLVPHAQWPLDTSRVTFELNPVPAQPLRLMLRAAGRTLGSFDALLCRPRECGTASAERYTDIVIAVLAGNQMLAAAGYLLLLCFWRQRAFALMAGSVAAYGLYELSLHGLAFQYLWPEATGWAPRSLMVLMGVSQLLQSLAVGSILPLRQVALPLRLVLIVAWLAMAGTLAMALWGDYRALAPAVNALTGLCGLLTLVLAAWAWRLRVPLAGWAAVVMAASVIGALPRYAYLLGWLELGPMVTLATPTVLLLSHLILLVALVQRMARLREAELAAQAQLLDERAARGRELERQVEQRTGELRDALQEAREQHRQRSRLLAYIGHDLRAPLAATVSYLRLLGGRGQRDQQMRASVEHGVAYQLALIDELVEFSRGELKALDLVPAPVYIHGLLHELAEQGELLARDRGNTLQAHIAAALPAVLVADAKRLRQLLLNLLSNACKFTVAGRIEFSAGAGTEPGWWRFEVADNGRGISPEDQTHLFEPFWRAAPQAGEAGNGTTGANADSPPGSGLGLSVARHVVEAMGGRMQVHSAVGQGSRFVLELPLPPGRAEDILLPGEGLGHVNELSADLPAGLLALVMDTPVGHADRVTELLFAIDADVQRLEATAPLPPAELLLCDPALLDAGGFARLRTWRGALPGRRCIALLDRPLPPAMAAQFDARLYKPISATALLTALSCLPGRAATEEAASPRGS